MLKKIITYTDFNGQSQTEEHYFHLSKSDLIEMEVSQRGGMAQYLEAVVKSEDGKKIIETFKDLILDSYGQKSEDGKRFLKSQALRDEFASTEAYSTLFMELCTNAEAAAEFVNGIVPANLEQDMAKITANTLYGETTATTSDVQEVLENAPRVLTPAEIDAMDSHELKSGIATGRYRLS